jgi:hypothetical protein
MDNIALSYEIARLMESQKSNDIDINTLALMIESILIQNENKLAPFPRHEYYNDSCMYDKGKY